MAAKVKSYPVQGGHTAGIFADMTVDGPDIGTLVAIVDRAKNLPNRKTIGKQDPYCAARLGKEARKTATDIRGGQTPKWDQELRFPVHDSADYYQLKISIFTDDKKTDLIGEAWIDLKNIVVPGGGQADVWQSLTCKGKYAGEIRIEITYYDTRPKPEKLASKAKQPASTEQEASSLRQRSPAKRRPLPSDPVTGEAAPIAAPHAAPPAIDHHQQTPPRNHIQTSSLSGFIPNQSPLQAVEYSTPPPATRQHYQDHYSPSPQSQSYSTPQRVDGPRQAPRSRDHYDTPPRHHDDREYAPNAPVSPYDQQLDPRDYDRYSPQPERYDVSPMDSPRDLPPASSERPPPPPVHRSRHNSPAQEAPPRPGYDVSPQKSASSLPMRHDVLVSEAHRYSTPAYPGRPTFRAYDSAPPAPSAPAPANTSPYDGPSPRHHSYDSAYEPQHRSMQPTVEDAPDSPTQSYGHSSRRISRHEEMAYDSAPSPMPMNMSRSPGASPHYMSQSPRHNQGSYQDSHGHAPRDHSNNPGHAAHYSRHSQGQYPTQRSELEANRIQTSPGYMPPALPASLSPGVDPALSMEISDRIYEERRHSRYGDQHVTTPTRGRQQSEPPSSYVSGAASSPQGFAPQPYDRRSGITYSNGPEPPMPRQKNISPSVNPNQQHGIRRKSVSPAPPQAESRRLSQIPFGPDSYDELNPSLVPTKDRSPVPEPRDPNAKIIAYDGREIDPSDHLPEETWAPEPEPKPNQKKASDHRPRPSLAGAQPMPPSGRRPLRVARPSPAPANPPSYYSEDPHTPPAPVSAGRNRLQKKAARASAGPSQSASSPLAPMSPENYQDRQSPYTPTRGGGHRGGSWDYPSENHTSYQHGGGPPIPAKVPLPVMRGANGGEAALMEEMQRIDIGAGRSRRRGGY